MLVSDENILTFKYVIESVGVLIDSLGVAIIVAGLVIASFRYLSTGINSPNGYKRYRQDLGRGILLGLEFLVAADIIRTVATEPTLQGVLILGLIVLIRTFLSMALQVEARRALALAVKRISIIQERQLTQIPL